MIRHCFAMLVMTICLLAAPAWADTDYRCLKNCIGGGGNSSTCMESCSYTAPEKASGALSQSKADLKPDKSQKPTTRQFDTMKRAGGIMLSKPDDPAMTVDKNYACRAECMKDKLQYQLCENKCARLQDAAGNVLLHR